MGPHTFFFFFKFYYRNRFKNYKQIKINISNSLFKTSPITGTPSANGAQAPLGEFGEGERDVKVGSKDGIQIRCPSKKGLRYGHLFVEKEEFVKIYPCRSTQEHTGG